MVSQWQRWKGIMKAYPFEEKRLLKWQPPYIVQPKYDGFRVRAIPIETGPKGDEYIFLSSEENIFFSVPHLNEIFRRLHLRAEFDGELYNHKMYLEGGFNLISSVVSRTVNLHPRHQEIQFHMFDIVNDQLQMRRNLLIEALKGLTPWIQVAPFWLCETLDEVLKTYDKLIAMGYEGMIVRHFQNPYVRKRSTMVMKFKPKEEDVYPIVGWKEEYTNDGVAKGRLGALVCASGDGDTFSVGTGFSDAQRETLWAVRESLPGNYAKVRYQHLTAGRKRPRHSVFVEVVKEVPNGQA